MEKYNTDEHELFVKYFKSNMNKMTLFKKLHAINPRRSFESMARTIRKMKADGMVKDEQSCYNNLRVGYLDIEATNLSANFGYILSWYIKEKGKNHYDYSVITKKEIQTYDFDKRVVTELLEAMKNYSVLYVHYGSDRRFDIPFIRTRAFINGLEKMLPDYMDVFIMDTYPIARNKLKLNSNRLGTIAEALGVKVKKTPLLGKQWNLAAVGNEDALKYIALHNKKDVDVLEKVHEKLAYIERPLYRSM
jgi:uncharacterized protein YprB with RNaseH-like and TPR domain